ncbi:GIY-YIG nuclease family protein [Candidatus Uhrbacteria bacterium]|nr:GIY-YIG nuclease family protein [Candidatus Uhrbacteria bacterium]
MEKLCCVYVMSNKHNNVIYIGVTSNLARRVWEHQQHLIPGFTSKYNCTKLVYVETTSDIKDAIAREKELKGWRREKKNALINSANPQWQDLSSEIY